MCLLTFLPAHVMPDTTALLNGAAINNDGHGFAIVTPDRLIVRHGLDPEHIVAAFDTLRRQHPQGPALFHSRFSTHGRQHSIDNCHPFPVGGDQRTVLAHNGVLPTIVHPAKDDPRSDTRITAEDFLPWFGSLRASRVRRRFERWMTPSNLAVILTVDRRFKQQAYIFNEEQGIWDGDIWYSNDGYLPPLPDRTSLRREWRPWERMEPAAMVCQACQAYIHPADDVCLCCGWCPGCGETAGTCLCYRPDLLSDPAHVAQLPLAHRAGEVWDRAP